MRKCLCATLAVGCKFSTFWNGLHNNWLLKKLKYYLKEHQNLYSKNVVMHYHYTYRLKVPCNTCESGFQDSSTEWIWRLYCSRWSHRRSILLDIGSAPSEIMTTLANSDSDWSDEAIETMVFDSSVEGFDLDDLWESSSRRVRSAKKWGSLKKWTHASKRTTSPRRPHKTSTTSSVV